MLASLTRQTMRDDAGLPHGQPPMNRTNEAEDDRAVNSAADNAKLRPWRYAAVSCASTDKKQDQPAEAHQACQRWRAGWRGSSAAVS